MIEKGVFLMKPHVCLNDLQPGQQAIVQELRSTGSIRRRLLDMGLIQNTIVQCLGRSPGGDPSAFLIRGADIAIRAVDGQHIWVTPC